MLYLAIPAHNEVATIGVLLWRLRTVLAEFPREYEVVVYDDASTDETAAVAEQYVHAMPVTVLRGATSVGYAGAVDALVRHIAAHTRYPRRDAMLLLQGDFTDPPGIVPEFARRFEGGADLVVGERTAVVDAPIPVRRLFSAAGWALRPFVKVEGVRDLTGSMRLIRIQALRDLLRTVGDDSVCVGDSWTANADLLLRLVPHARRVETVPMEPTYGVRTRDTRRVTVRDALAALRWGWRARGRRAVPTSAPETVTDTPSRSARPSNTSRRREEPELTADRLRERSRDRDKLRGEQDAPRSRREGRPEREARDATRVAQSAELKADRRDRKRDEKGNGKRDEKRNEERNDKRSDKQELTETRRNARNESQPRRERKPSLAADADVILDDPFAGPASRSHASKAPRPSPVEADATEPDERLNQEAPSASPRAELDPSPAESRLTSPVDATARGADDADDDTGDDDAEDVASDLAGDAEAGDAEAGDDISSASRERKRRRNRRSRRRRSKQRGDAAEFNSDSSATGQDDALPAITARETDIDAAARHDVVRRNDADRADVDRDDDGGDDDGGDDDSGPGAEATLEGEAAGDGDSGDQAARARRRGRRGRRGGSRRSRTRGRNGEDADRPSGDSPASPPSGDVG